MDLFKSCKTQEEADKRLLELNYTFKKNSDIRKIVEAQFSRWTPLPKSDREIIMELNGKLMKTEAAYHCKNMLIESLSKNNLLYSIRLLLAIRKEAKNAQTSSR